MIEQVCHQIVTDLGPTGLLILGLFVVIGIPLRNISSHIAIINHEIGEIITLLKVMNAKKEK